MTRKYIKAEDAEREGLMCHQHQVDLKAEATDEETGEVLNYSCPECDKQQTLNESSACKSCGALIKWATTKSGKKMPLDMKPTTGRLEDGSWVQVRISHFITCPSAEQHKTSQQKEKPDGPPERRPPDQPPRTGAKWDKCQSCDTATEWTVSDQRPKRDGEGYIQFENWTCPEGCGNWWKIKGSKYKPQWRDR